VIVIEPGGIATEDGAIATQAGECLINIPLGTNLQELAA